MSLCWLLAAGPSYEHKSVQREPLNIMCLYYFSWECVTYLCATPRHGCLYVYDCICMIVCVRLYDNVGMMS